MKKILVVGSLNMDYTIYVNEFPLEGETIYGNSRFIQPGGKGENQAVAIAKSGKVVCHMIGAIGNDSDGEKIQNVLSSSNVVSHLLIKNDSETGNATITVDGRSENEIVIIAGANNELKPEDIDLNLLNECDYVVLQNEILNETNMYVMKKAHEAGKVVVYNPAPYREVDNEIFQYVDYFVPNEVELSKYSQTNDIEEGIKVMRERGVKNILVTLGTKGSMLVNDQERIKVDCYKVHAVDTVAAGDTYVGYFASSLASGLSIRDSMDKASKASSITVSRKGSVVSIPLGKEVY